MKVAAFADCHNDQRALTTPPDTDLIAVAGDWTVWGKIEEALNFLDWLSEQPAPYKVVVPGNHDFCAEQAYGVIKRFCKEREIILLVDDVVEIEGKRICGSPRTPWFGDYAFVYQPFDADLVWDAVLPNCPRLDLLITHGPPLGILDQVREGQHAGCPHLARKVREIKPRFHIFGHIHPGYGEFNDGDTQYYNVAVNHPRLGACRPMTVFEL